jgi:outer membrane phospholipase A
MRKKTGNIERSLILFIALFACAAVPAAGVFAQADTSPASPPAEQAKQQDGDNGACNKKSPISTYKINYFTLNNWPANNDAQVKFQFSVKYKFFDWDASLWGRPLALYLAYSQKSLWNVGQNSMPFEESNYNPETFLNYTMNTRGPVALRDVILGLYEHESNGLAGPQSRGWNRFYAAVRLGYLPLAGQCAADPAQYDHVELYLKVWHAYGYSDETSYLRSIGSNETFLGFEGHGEVNLVLRDIIFQGGWGNRIDMTSRVGGRRNFEFQYQQKIPSLNFSPYFQYWYGYDETLLRFDRFGRRAFVGVSFAY